MLTGFASMRLIFTLGVLIITALLVMGLVLLRNRQPERDQVRMLPRDRDVAVLYVALGDSTVAGLGASSPQTNYVSRLYARLREVYPRAQVTNLGVSGATSADVVRDQLPRTVALQPHLVTLSIGPNDITQGKDVEQYERNVEMI
jgi:lysophospholipase L1-like esterase